MDKQSIMSSSRVLYAGSGYIALIAIILIAEHSRKIFFNL